MIKGTVSVILSDPPCKECNARFTAISVKALSDQKCVRYDCFPYSKSDNFSAAAYEQETPKCHFAEKP